MKFLKKFTAIAVIVGALTSSCFAGNILIINGASTTSETDTTAAITTNLRTLMQAVGNTVTVVDAVPATLAGFSQVWDIRFSNSSPITSSDQALYLAFLQAGGGMFAMAENSGFATRNNSVLALIAAAGGGTISFTSPSDYQVVVAPFTNPNGPVTQVQYAASGGFSSKGTGSWITKVDGVEQGTGIAFGVGTLANAPKGALTTIFDVNFMMNTYDVPNSQNLTKNLIGFVAAQVEPPPPVAVGVPDSGSTVAMASLAIFSLVAVRRFSRSKS